MGDLPRSPDDNRCSPQRRRRRSRRPNPATRFVPARVPRRRPFASACSAGCHIDARLRRPGLTLHTAPTLRLAIPMLTALSATRFVRPRWPTIGHCLVTRRRRLHNATHHVDRGHQNTFRFRTRTALVGSALVAEMAGSGRPSRPRCALNPNRARQQTASAPDPTSARQEAAPGLRRLLRFGRRRALPGTPAATRCRRSGARCGGSRRDQQRGRLRRRRGWGAGAADRSDSRGAAPNAFLRLGRPADSTSTA